MKSLLSNRNYTFFLTVILPMLCASFYYVLIATEQYESVASVVIRQEEKQTPLPMGLNLANAAANTPGMTDALEVEEYIMSKDMFNVLQDSINIRAHYSDSGIDTISRLPADASSIEFYEYFIDKLYVEVDEVSAILTIKAKAFSPEFSKLLLEEIVRQSEAFVNEVGHAIAREKMRFVQNELQSSENKVREETRNLLKLQDKHGMLTADSETATMTEIIGVLEGELVAEQTQLKGLLAFLNSGAPEVKVSKARIDALKSQLRLERAKQTGDGENNLNDVFVEFKEAELSLQFALGTYEAALEVLQTTRLDAARKLKYLVEISKPNLPDKAEYPKRLYILITLFVILVIVHGIARLIYATVLDHRD